MKLTDKQFLAILRQNGGLYAKTAKAITKAYDVEYTRQAVRERALKFPDELADIEAEVIDLAEDSLQSLMTSENERVRFAAIQLFLKTKGKQRGYSERTDHEERNLVINLAR